MDDDDNEGRAGKFVFYLLWYIAGSGDTTVVQCHSVT